MSLRAGIGVLVLAATAAMMPAYAADREVSIASFLKTFASEHNIQIEGLELLGRDTFTPPVKQGNVDKTLRRALSRYNTIEHYGESGVVRVVILGRKGSSVGELPQDYAPEPEAPEPEVPEPIQEND